MLTADAVKSGADILAKNGVENSLYNSELLMCKVLNVNRFALLSEWKKRELKETNRELFLSYITRRAKREPLQYIEENVNFYGLDINVNKNVLIPRPETEELVSIVVEKLKDSNQLNILDIGTGSGCIALALASKLSNSSVIGIDFSKAAVETAEFNKSKLSINNVHFVNASLEEYIIPNNIDVIVSNPPYISMKDYEELEPELFFEPKSALTDGGDGLYFYKLIYNKIKLFDCNKIKLFFEIGCNQAQDIKNIFSGYKIDILKDMNKIDRFILINN
ncbi:MAG: peptide chain release factor N(5)-glutamine methyltransferase [Bacteroidetes bacterium]|nr:peptide chain release factor N(5)-glutamine methyltransferase [Bacteroidota bacterium]